MFINRYFSFIVLPIVFLKIKNCIGRDDEEGPYLGKYLGKINSYHHQVSGDVYAVNEYTLLIVAFNYDGNGIDTFFWAGASNRPGPQGFIVPDEYGLANVLERYFNKDITLTLPDHKKITEIKWFAIYDINTQNTFGDIYIPDEFEPPTKQKISQLSGRSHDVFSESLEIIDAKTILIPNFKYNGKGQDVYFWCGIGPFPTSKGQRIPDEKGYLNNIREYKGEEIKLDLPGELTVFDIDWLSIYDLQTNENFGSVNIPDGLNVPPSLVKTLPYKSTLPNCHQFHREFQVSWEVFGPQVTIQLAGQVDENDYMAFGLSGSQEKSQMIGSDVTIAYIDAYRGFSADYNITAMAPCGQVLGQYKGVCKDELVGGQDSNQFITAVRENGINIITYRRTLISSDNGDQEYLTDKLQYVIWAIGRLDHNKDPTIHSIYPKLNNKLEFGRKEPMSNCFSFTQKSNSNQLKIELWERGQIFDRTIRVFKAILGPSGGKKGYQGITGQTSNALSWYINGLLAPEIWLRRGLTYSFKIFGGNNPHSAEYYHPFIITDEPNGGFDKLSTQAQSDVRVLAGVEFTRRGKPRPTAAGPLCLGKHKTDSDRRLDDDFITFAKFNRSLEWSCEQGDPAILEVTPNTSWPDTVYYNSFTHSNMGWKIHIVDTYTKSNANILKYVLYKLMLLPSFFLLLN